MITAPERCPSDTTLTGIALFARSMMSGASMYAALIRPVMRDSLISGQPLYLLNSNSEPLVRGASLSAEEAAHATGSVRLHVTGRPPTWSGAAAPWARGRAPARARAAAAAPCRSCLRSKKCVVRATLSLTSQFPRVRPPVGPPASGGGRLCPRVESAERRGDSTDNSAILGAIAAIRRPLRARVAINAAGSGNDRSLAELRLQPVGELGEVDHHALVRACSDHFGTVSRPDRKFDALSVDVRHLGLACDGMACGRRGQMADIHPRAERALAGVEERLQRVERGVLHHHDHDGRGEHGRQHRILEPVGEMLGRDEKTEGALGSGRQRLHEISLWRKAWKAHCPPRIGARPISPHRALRGSYEGRPGAGKCHNAAAVNFTLSLE